MGVIAVSFLNIRRMLQLVLLFTALTARY